MDLPTSRGVPAPAAAALAALAMLVVLAACGSGAAPAGSSAAPGTSQPAATVGDTSAAGDTSEPTSEATVNLGPTGGLCALVPQADVESAAGGKVTNVVGEAQACTRTLEDFRTINFRIEKEQADLSGAKLLFPKGQSVGVGDDSWWGGGENGLLGNLLYFVAKGRTYAVQLVLFGNDDAKNMPLAVAIARKALDRI